MGRHVRVQYSYVANEGPRLTFMTNLKAQRYRCVATVAGECACRRNTPNHMHLCHPTTSVALI